MKLFLKVLTVLVFLLTAVGVNAQNSHRIYKGVSSDGNKVIIEVNDGVYQIIPYGHKIVETSFLPSGSSYEHNSHAVVLNPKGTFNVKDSQDKIELINDEFKVEVIKSPFQISYVYKDEHLVSERYGYVKDSLEILDFNLTKNEVLYGAGARALGMNRRGHRLQLYNRAHYGYETHSELMNFTMPLVLSSKLYALHFDNAPIGYLDLDSTHDNSLKYETISGRMTYQVIVGDRWEDLIDQYTTLTGKQPMIPRWALGNFSSRFGYHSQEETINTINKFKEEEIPVDAVILDLYWFGKDIKGTMGNFEFHKDSFPDPKKMISDLKDKGVKTVLITEPFVLTTSSKWEEAVEKDVLGKREDGSPYSYDFYFGNTGIIDIFKPAGKQWFWDIYKKYTDMGISGWWGDLGEPEVHPSDLLHASATADEVHNVYGHYWAKLVADGYQKYFPEQRPFILMRAGYSGSQHYGMIPWSGDVNRTWGGLQSQVEIALQMGMQGMAFMHSDLGGFAGANLDDELYVRWLQYGVFQPIYRPHAQEDVPSEPVFRAEKAKLLAKKAIELRYQLLPYNYSLTFENNQTGKPLMRPLFFEDTKEELLNYDTTYFWGEHFLISPVKEAGLKTQEIYFPQGANWYDFYSNEKIAGGQSKKLEISENYIPTFVRGGAFIPMIETIQNTESYRISNLKVHYYFDEESKENEDKLYHDDGITPKAYENGAYELIKFKSTFKNNQLEISIKTEIGKTYKAVEKNIELIIHNVLKKPQEVNQEKYKWDSEKQLLSIQIKLGVEEKILKIKL